MLARLAVVRPRGTAEPIQGRLNDRIPSRREDRVAAWNSHIRREAGGDAAATINRGTSIR
jgi:hypothetical protein